VVLVALQVQLPQSVAVLHTLWVSQIAAPVVSLMMTLHLPSPLQLPWHPGADVVDSSCAITVPVIAMEKVRARTHVIDTNESSRTLRSVRIVPPYS